MKICLVHEEYPEETNFGGIATYQKRLAEEYVRQGHTVYVIARGIKQDRHYVENGVNITRIFIKQTADQKENYIKYRQRVAGILLEMQEAGNIDIIEVPDWGAETVFFENDRKVPLVVRLHTPLKVWLKFNKNNFGEITNQLLEWEDTMLSRADLVTCCSHVLKRMIVKDFNILSKNILVTPNPADLQNFYKDTNIKKENRIVYVGSLEERKGVAVLAKALNIFLKKHPNVDVDFIGKDTTRNNKNISTIDYIKQIVDAKYLSNLHFLGQLNNSELNFYYNRARVAVFPSLFDNFPYVVLEAMATGVQVVGSKNSGMVEMLADHCVYETPNHTDLARLLHEKYELSKTEPYNTANIKRVKRLYVSSKICQNMIRLYEKTIKDYEAYYVSSTIINEAIVKAGLSGKVKSIIRQKKGVSNAVYKIHIDNRLYIIKKYNYNIDFNISSKLYDIYDGLGVGCVRPINKKPIVVGEMTFNIFPFINGKYLDRSNVESLLPLIFQERKVSLNNKLKEKCDFYYQSLLKYQNIDELIEDASLVLEKYAKIISNPILNETYINHGDLSRTNIIKNRQRLYVIDFDETTVGPMLYDFAVICVKFLLDRNGFDTLEYERLKRIVVDNTKYKPADCDVMLTFYLCKILMEKFYLHLTGKINIFSIEQKRDNYIKYLKALKND